MTSCLNLQHAVRFGYLINALTNGVQGLVCVPLFRDKRATKAFLQHIGVPVPGNLTAEQVNPNDTIVVKPCCATGGRGVRIGLAKDVLGLQDDRLIAPEPGTLMEQFVTGNHYRVVVYHGTVLGAVRRTPASVTGDGTHTVRQLIELSTACRRLVPDESNSGLDQVPPAGVAVPVNKVSNFAQGGSVAVAPDVHDTVRELCRRVALFSGVALFGVDLITPDIAAPLPPSAAVNELELFNDMNIHYLVRDRVWTMYVCLGIGYGLLLLIGLTAVAITTVRRAW